MTASGLSIIWIRKMVLNLWGVLMYNVLFEASRFCNHSAAIPPENNIIPSFSLTMSMTTTTDNSSPVSSPATILAEIPANFVLKQKIDETAAYEMWDVFDRVKKRKFVLRRIKKLFCGNENDQTIFGRFQKNLLTLDQLRQNGTAVPGILLLGQDTDGFWYLREPAAGRSLAEIAVGKSMREHEIARRLFALTESLNQLHQTGQLHRQLHPTNVFSSGIDDAVFVDPDICCFLDPSLAGENYDPSAFGPTDFLAPEQRRKTDSAKPLDARTDLWSLGALLGFVLTGKKPPELQPDQITGHFRALLLSSLKENPAERLATLPKFLAELEQIVRVTKPSSFETADSRSVILTPNSTVTPTPTPVSAQPPVTPVATPPVSVPVSASIPVSTPSPTAAPQPISQPGASLEACSILMESVPQGTVCPQCHTPVRSATDRLCPQCSRPYQEPCLNCQSTNPFWFRTCRGCSSDIAALKQKMLATLNSQKQQILKMRETYGHDRTLPLLKYMSTVNHPDFNAFKEWAKNMTALIQKERRDIKAYVDNIRVQTNAAMAEQKYDKVQQILEQVPRPLLDEPLRQQYVEAGEILTEVDSLVREIRNAISTKRYSQLLSCVQRYLELKANDPEAKSLQQKIEKLTTITSSQGMKLRRIPSGRFYMGSHDSDEYLRNNEHPQHRVFITRNLFIGVYPVTQGEFLQLMEFNPSIASDKEQCPADSVTWYSALEFCNKMSEAEQLPPYYELKAVKRRANGSIEDARVVIGGGDGYRLLTEAEWEYACRAGSITPWCYGDLVVEVGDYAWYYDNSSMETHPVGEKKPNSWGLYDMHGNIMEWCHDCYNEFYYQQCADEEENPTGPEEGVSKVLRGGAWQFGVESTRCAYRNSSSPNATSNVIGFRVCRNAPDDGLSLDAAMK
jgi:formylglycine-generating enzyme required for sulfatase activity/serine/threonine protein kinase